MVRQLDSMVIVDPCNFSIFCSIPCTLKNFSYFSLAKKNHSATESFSRNTGQAGPVSWTAGNWRIKRITTHTPNKKEKVFCNLNSKDRELHGFDGSKTWRVELKDVLMSLSLICSLLKPSSSHHQQIQPLPFFWAMVRLCGWALNMKLLVSVQWLSQWISVS